MCFATMAAISIGAGLIGGGVKAYGDIEQGQAVANAANYQAQVAQNNAAIAEGNAQYALEAGQTKTQTQGMKVGAQVSSIKARQGGAGVDVNSGSAVDVRASQREIGRLDEETVMNNAELQMYGYRSQAANFQAEGGLKKAEAEQAPIGAALAAAGDLLGTASGTASKAYPYFSSGGGGGINSLPGEAG